MPYFMKTSSLIIAGLVMVSASADTEILDSISIRFAEGLLFGPDFGQATFYSDIVDSFPDVDLPEQYELMGSVDLVYSTQVILRADMKARDAEQVLVDKLLTTDFAIIPKMGAGLESRGFVALEQLVRPVAFCRDDIGSVLARFRETDADSIITLSHSVTGPSGSLSCNEYIEKQRIEATQHAERLNTGLRVYEPRLVMPQPPRERGMSFGSGSRFSGGNGYFESSSSLVTDWPIAQVYQYFANQISGQGWEFETENTLDEKIVGEWTFEPDTELSLIGTFTVQEMTGSKYSVVFRLDQSSPIITNNLYMRTLIQ